MEPSFVLTPRPGAPAAAGTPCRTRTAPRRRPGRGVGGPGAAVIPWRRAAARPTFRWAAGRRCGRRRRALGWEGLVPSSPEVRVTSRPAGPAVVRVIFLLSAVSSEWSGQRLRSGDETGECCVTVMKRIRLSGGVSAPAADYSIHDRSSVKFKFDSLRRTDPNLNGPSSFLSGPRRCVSNFRSADNNLKNLNTRQAAGPGRWPGPSGPGPTVSVQPGTQGLYLQ